MQAKKRALTTLLVVLFITAVFPMGVSAAMGFGVQPVIPSNQNGSASTYFDLTVEPGQRQDLTITVTNQSDEDIVVSVGANAASTNRSGVIVYNDPEGPLDDSVPFNLTDMLQVQQDSWTIAPGESQNVTATLTVPDTEFDGVVLGGIRILKELTEEELNSGAMILNQYSYTIGVQLQMNQNPVQPAFAMGNVQASLTNHRASIVADIHLTSPMVVKGAVASAWIYPKDSDTTVIEVVQDNINFAPNAVFPFSLVDEAGYGFEAGDYIAVVLLSYDDKTWEFEQDFTIEPEEVAEINSLAVNQQTNTAARNRANGSFPTWAIIAIAVGGTLLVVAIVLVVVMMKQSKKREEALYRQLGIDPNAAPPAAPAQTAPTATPAPAALQQLETPPPASPDAPPAGSDTPPAPPQESAPLPDSNDSRQ